MKDDEIDINSKELDELENELFGVKFNSVPKDLQNPCPLEVSLKDFRNDNMSKVNNQIYKMIIKPGVGSTLNLERTIVNYDYAMFLEAVTDPFDSSFLNKTLGLVSVKTGVEPTPGCYLALSSMKKGEEAVFWISNELMFGKLGKLLFIIISKSNNSPIPLGCPPRVPAAADILFRAKITKVEDAEGCEIKDDNDPHPAFRKLFKEATKNHKAAGEHFNQRSYHKAIDIYRKWINKLESTHVPNEELEMKLKELLIKMYQNICICYNNIKKPEKTCVMMRELENLTPIAQNAKALFAKGRANLMLNNYDLARRCLLKAERLSPNSQTVIAALLELDNQERTKIQHDADSEELSKKFEMEAALINAQNHQSAEMQDLQEKALEDDLDEFKGKFEELIEEFKNDDALRRLSLTVLDIHTQRHVQLAEHICRQHSILLKGTQMLHDEKVTYYLSK